MSVKEKDSSNISVRTSAQIARTVGTGCTRKTGNNGSDDRPGSSHQQLRTR
jgi:hypothetical protein